jgi:hypothetical protein
MDTTYRAQSPARLPREWNRELGPPRERDARDEIERLRDQIEGIIQVEREEHARDAIDSALTAVTRLQVVTANLDACHPPPAAFAGPALVALADRRLRGAADAIERGMTYTADNQLRLLQVGRGEHKQQRAR